MIGTENAFCTLSRDLALVIFATGAKRTERQAGTWPLTAALFCAYDYFLDTMTRFCDLLTE